MRNPCGDFTCPLQSSCWLLYNKQCSAQGQKSVMVTEMDRATIEGRRCVSQSGRLLPQDVWNLLKSPRRSSVQPKLKQIPDCVNQLGHNSSPVSTRNTGDQPLSWSSSCVVVFVLDCPQNYLHALLTKHRRGVVVPCL